MSKPREPIVRLAPFAEPDVGPQFVDYIREMMQVDEQWSLVSARGFRWWGYRLAQTVTADPPRQSNRDSVVRVTSVCDLLVDVPDKAETYRMLSEVNGCGGLYALVYDSSAGTVRSFLSCIAHQGNPWLSRVLAFAVTAQIGVAEARADQLASWLSARVARSTHPGSGERREPDDMLGAFDNVPAAPEALGAWGYEKVAELGAQIWLATSGPDGMTAEMPYEPDAVPVSMLAALGDHRPAGTALLTITNNTLSVNPGKPSLSGHGLAYRLRLPTTFEAVAAYRLANDLNQMETEEWTDLHLLGAWSADNGDLSYSSFVPDVLLPSDEQSAAIVAFNLAAPFLARSRWARQALTR